MLISFSGFNLMVPLCQVWSPIPAFASLITKKRGVVGQPFKRKGLDKKYYSKKETIKNTRTI